jgi:hypothetical protein
MMCLEGIQRPIGISDHSNPSLSADQDSHVRRSVAGLHCVFRRIEDLNGVVYEPAHEFLIGAGERSLNVFYRAVTLSGSAASPRVRGSTPLKAPRGARTPACSIDTRVDVRRRRDESRRCRLRVCATGRLHHLSFGPAGPWSLPCGRGSVFSFVLYGPAGPLPYN